MSTYPGDNPQQPEDQRPADETSDAEPTQPVGYWERQAAEKRAREQGQQPTTPYPQGYPGQAAAPQNPYGAPPQHHGYPPPPPASVPSAPPASPPPGQAGPYAPPPLPPGAYGPPPPGTYPAQAYGYRAPAPDHPQSTLSLVLGLVGLIGAFVFCGLPLVVSPFAWALGRNALKEIRASGGRLGGESQARTGMILGIIGTVLAVLALLGLVAFIVAVAATDSTSTTGSSV